MALLDVPDVAATTKKLRFARERIRSFSTAFHRDGSLRFGYYVLAVVARSLRKATNLASYLVGNTICNLRDVVRMRMFRYFTDRSLPLPRFLEGIPVQTVCLFAERQYRPDGQFAGELVLFRATHGEGSDEPFALDFDDPLFGGVGGRRGASRRSTSRGGTSACSRNRTSACSPTTSIATSKRRSPVSPLTPASQRKWLNGHAEGK